VLEYERVDVKVGETHISIYGCPTTGYYSSADNVLEAIKVEDDNDYNILLAHIFYEGVFNNWKGDLILSGTPMVVVLDCPSLALEIQWHNISKIVLQRTYIR